VFPNVFTGQPTFAPGIIQHHSLAPTSDPSQTAAQVAPQQPLPMTQQNASGAILGCPGGCEDVSLKDVSSFVLPWWAKIAAAVLLIGGAGTAIYFGTRE